MTYLGKSSEYFQGQIRYINQWVIKVFQKRLGKFGTFSEKKSSITLDIYRVLRVFRLSDTFLKLLVGTYTQKDI